MFDIECKKRLSIQTHMAKLTKLGSRDKSLGLSEPLEGSNNFMPTEYQIWAAVLDTCSTDLGGARQGVICRLQIWQFPPPPLPKKGMFLGAPIRRRIVLWGLYWGPPLGKLPVHTWAHEARLTRTPSQAWKHNWYQGFATSTSTSPKGPSTQ